MEITFLFEHDLAAILEATDQADRNFHLLAIVHVARRAASTDPRPIRGATLLYELRTTVDDLVYGTIMEPRSGGFEALAYWRSPPTAGFDRVAAINLALQRRSAS